MSYPGFNLFNLVTQVNTNTASITGASGSARYAVSGGAFQSKPLIFSGSGGMDVRLTDVGSGLLVNYGRTEKEIFFFAGVNNNNHYLVTNVTTGNSAFYNFYIPQDFVAMNNIEVFVLVNSAGAAANNTILTHSTSYTKPGLSSTLFQETVATTYQLSGSGANMVSLPITGILLNASGGMVVGLEIATTQASGTFRFVHGLFKYR